MPVDTPSPFAQAIQEHLELKRRNAALDGDMPLDRYMEEDRFENNPLFKSEEQARIEDTMSGQESIVDAPSALAWPTEESFAAVPSEPVAEPDPVEADSDEDSGLWSRSRDFDWGD